MDETVETVWKRVTKLFQKSFWDAYLKKKKKTLAIFHNLLFITPMATFLMIWFTQMYFSHYGHLKLALLKFCQ